MELLPPFPEQSAPAQLSDTDPSVDVAGYRVLCFLAGDTVRSLSRIDAESRGQITIPNLTAAFSAWEGKQLPGLNDKSLASLPGSRIVQEDWRLNWLRTIWPALCDPILVVATDEPDAILPAFPEFETVSATYRPAPRALPEHVRDFGTLRRADYLTICKTGARQRSRGVPQR
jgi:hypothetical protein